MNKKAADSKADNDPVAGKTGDPAAAQVYDYLVYGLSLPERAVRTTSALLGGAISESAALLLPQAFRSSKSYDVFVQQMLDFMVRDIGSVDQSSDPSTDPAEQRVESYVARKAIGSLIDMAGLATIHLSPLTVLAIVSDVAYGSQIFLNELSDELKNAGVIDSETTIDHAADLLDALGKASAVTAEAFDAPPLSIEGLQETIAQTQEAVEGIDPSHLLPQAEVQQLWDQMHRIANEEGVGVLDVSSAMTLFAIGKIGTLGQGALSTAKVTGNMFDRHILDHYRQGLNQITDKGFYVTYAEVSRPYIEAIWCNFASEKSTITEELLNGKLVGKAWRGLMARFDGS